ncbi:branched-chain alpha-keto acid dehydrogenase subunit E2, partial [Streptomyces nanshensis]
MASVREFTLPDLGEGLTEATVVRWLVAVGDVVAVDQSVVEVETAKALVDVPCPYGGVVTARYGEEGAEIPVGAPLLTVAVGASQEETQQEPQQDAPPAAAARTEASAAQDENVHADAEHVHAEAESSGNVLVGYGTGAPAGRRRRSRPVDGFRPPAAAASAPPPAPRAAEQGPVAVISPLVRRIAREHDLDLRGITGTGPDGLILRADVERAAGTREATGQTAPA